MSARSVSVAIPVLNGGALLAGVLDALAVQSVEHELLVCDSGSSDGSVDVCRAHGARVIEIPRSEFSHGGTRNLLMREAAGAHVAMLTQDAEPADDHWLERLLGGFALGTDVALAFGPYVARADATAAVRMELTRWFASLAPDGRPCVERLAATERSLPASAFVGRRGFFSDANACVLRAAWERVPFRDVAYAEDRALALDMLRAGYAKAYVPGAAVLHSHAYTAGEQLRRSFDEWRGLLEVYGWREPASPRGVLGRFRGELRAAERDLAADGERVPLRTLAGVVRHHSAREAGAILGSRADRLPARVRRALSLDRRAGFAPLDLDEPTRTPSREDPR